MMPLINSYDRATALHNLISDDRKRRNTTTVVGNTAEEIAIVGTNEEYLRLEIRQGLLEHEIIARSRTGNHAEQNVIDETMERNLNLVEIGASRPICLDCEELIKDKGIETKTEYSGKISKNRRIL